MDENKNKIRISRNLYNEVVICGYRISRNHFYVECNRLLSPLEKRCIEQDARINECDLNLNIVIVERGKKSN